MLGRDEVSRVARRPRYPDPVDNPDSLVNGDGATSAEDPLGRSLLEENERLRAQNRLLTEQMVAVRGAQEELAKHLKVTAPLRRVQESLRHRAGQRRRRADEAGGGQPAAGLVPTPPSALAVSDEQATRHPLLA
jgi:hypothetical protein